MLKINHNVIQKITAVFVILGGLACGLIGILGWNFLDNVIDDWTGSMSFASVSMTVILVIVGLSALYQLYAMIRPLSFQTDEREKDVV